jgi:outer membrane protein assembly factor BamB
MIYRALTILAVCLSVLSCSTGDNSEPPAPLTDIEQPLPLKVHWTTNTGAGIDTASFTMRPLLVQNRFFSVDTEGLVKSIDAEKGKVKWKFETGLSAITGLAGNSEVLVASSRDGDLLAYNLLDQELELRWSIRLKGEIRATPVVDGQQVFVRTSDGKLAAISLLDGTVQWTVSRRVPALSLTGNSEPLVRGDLVYSGFDNGRIAAFNRVNGSTVWEVTVSNPSGRTEIERMVDLDGQFILRDGVIYISSYQGRLVAIQALDGNVLWSRKFSSFQSIEADDEALYLSSDNSHLWSIDRRTGSAFWMQDVLHARKITAPVLVDNRLVVADLEGYVHWFDKSDGALTGRVRPTDTRHLAQPQIWQEKVVVIDSDGYLSSISLK